MLDLDHIGITVKDLDESIAFYQTIGYQLINVFCEEGYNWATLELNNHSLELFQRTTNSKKNFDHIAYSYDDETDLIEKLGYKDKDLEVFYGSLNRKSFFIEDNNGKAIQFIKK